MRERRRTLAAGLMLLLAAAWLDRATPLVTVETALTDRAPATAHAALDLGILGTVVLSWTVKRLR